jgi:hypothetical protein
MTRPADKISAWIRGVEREKHQAGHELRDQDRLRHLQRVVHREQMGHAFAGTENEESDQRGAQRYGAIERRSRPVVEHLGAPDPERQPWRQQRPADVEGRKANSEGPA